MPAGYTHYQFGQDLLCQMQNQELKKMILKHKDLFNIGLHGPDIFFYHRPYYFKDKLNRYGKNMHHTMAAPFFNQARQHIENEDQLVYILGFICHYLLDSRLHGYIQEIINTKHISHFEIESQYDARFMIKNHLKPTHTLLYRHIVVNEYTVSHIQHFFPQFSYLEIEETLRSMHTYDQLLLAPNILKRGILYLGFLLTSHFQDLQGLVMNYKTNHYLDHELDHLDILYQQTRNETEKILLDYFHHQPLSSRFHHDYESMKTL